MANTLKFGNGEWYGKKDTILAYNDENNNYKPLPFDFSRDGSATRVNKDGLIETVGSGEPRVDYKDDSKGAMLLEPSRSNLVTHSEDTTEWDKNETPINTSNTTISPNGSRNADSVIVDSISEGFYDFSVGTVQSGTSYTFSIFIKYISGVETIRFGGSGGGFGGDNNNVFNIKNGTVVSAVSGNTLSVNDYGNGWYRLIATKTASSTATAAWILYGNENAEIQYSAWGVQVEQGSYPTSYIPTQGGVVTRLAESCSQTPPSGVIGQTEGVIFLDVKMPSVIQSSTTFSIGGGASGEYAQLEIRSDLSINWRYRQGNTDYINANVGSYVGGDRLKLAFAYKSGSSVLYKNGLSIAVDNGSIGANSWNNVYFSNYAGTGKLNANVNQMSLYNTRLSNSELQALTTI